MKDFAILLAALVSLSCVPAPGQSGIISWIKNYRSSQEVKYYFLSKESLDRGDKTYHRLSSYFDARDFENAGFDKKLKTKILIHGYDNNAKSDSVRLIREAYHAMDRCNVIAVDWSALDSSIYYTSLQHAVRVAEHVADLIDFLVFERLVDMQDLHLIGHSLGAHIAGLAAKKATAPGKLGRVTGLDPARPFVDLEDESSRLTSQDARLVDVIHTSASLLGIEQNIGLIDFYPNGGMRQPGCSSMDVLGVCSHGRSYELYAESIRNSKAFVGTRCTGDIDAIPLSCRDREPQQTAVMGEFIQFRKPGVYYLQTRGASPFTVDSIK